ncbi:MAG: hypothetical protein IKU71_05710 [Kiritimatiellae bacterium]|nr:hypothetical protein [Kiritimatiellia bacterium]
MFRKTASIFVAAIAACCAFAVNADGFDGKTLTTNDWFDASFTALAVDTVIATNTATGITFGAGTWTSAPTNGTAKIVADKDAGGGATMLAIDAPGEELTFTPAALASATGMETLTFDVCTEAVDELLTPDAQPQAAFTIYSDDGVTYVLKGYVDGGWTNLEYAAGADTLTNVWFTLYLDFATVSSVRYVRFSVKPAAAASATVLTDSEGTAWFPAAVPAATTVNSVSVTGTGSFRTFSGDSLEEASVGAASYNGVSYATLSEAIAAAVADSWANGSVTLLADVEWSPTAAGTYDIDVNGHVLTVNGAIYDISGTEYTVSGFKYYWIGSTALGGDGTSWSDAGNWARDAMHETAATEAPGRDDSAIFDNESVVALSADVYVTNVVANGNLSFSGGLIHTGIVSGNGTITLNGNAGFHTFDWEQANLQVSNNLVIAGTGNKFQTKGSNSYMNGGSIDIYGDVTGNGEITTIGKRSRVRFHGNWTEFAGTVNAQDDGVPRHVLRLMAAQSSSSNAVWNVWMSNESKGDSAFLGTSSNTYKTDDKYHYYFGALNGRITIYQQYNNTLEIGALNQDCAFTGALAATHRSHIKKVGSATLAFSGSGVGRLEVFGGVFSSRTESAIPNERITFLGNDAYFDPTTNMVDFAAKLVDSTTAPIGLLITNNVTIGEIPASNTAGLVKKGEGTLVLSAAPAYTGDTYLDGGTLKIPASANKTVKTHVAGKSVRTGTETIGEEEYTVYTLSTKRPMLFMVY